jgi:hypothetical protein
MNDGRGITGLECALGRSHCPGIFADAVSVSIVWFGALPGSARWKAMLVVPRPYASRRAWIARVDLIDGQTYI